MSTTSNFGPVSVPSIKQIADWIGTEVDLHYQNSGQGILLQELGGRFSRKFGASFQDYLDYLSVASKAEIAKGLRKMLPFIRVYCSNVRLEISDNDKTRVFAWPKSKGESGGFSIPAVRGDLKESISSDAVKQESTTGTVEQVKYVRPFWVAFIRPVQQGQMRFVTDSPKIFFKDFDFEQFPVGSEWKKIEQKYIVGAAEGEFADPDMIANNISSWAKDNSINLAPFLDRGGHKKDHERAINAGEKLSAFLESMPPELVRRISMPGDVILHLLQSKK